MLSYAFSILREDGYKKVATESFENTAELFAAILISGITLQVKRGLGREYIEATESLSSPKGKLAIAESLKRQTHIKKQLVCTYDEFSINSRMNQILKSSALLLLRSGITKPRRKACDVCWPISGKWMRLTSARSTGIFATTGTTNRIGYSWLSAFFCTRGSCKRNRAAIPS